MDSQKAPEQEPKKRGKLKMFLLIIVALILAFCAVLILGPRESFDPTLRFNDAQIESDVEAYLADSEANTPDIVPTATKEIIWAYPRSKAKTPLALVYLHGFSATKGETRPVSEMAAKALKANLFYTRLKGHGAGSAAMGEATGQDWMDDVAEAIEIGSRIGQKTIVIGASTGGTLASVAALHPALKDKIAGVILISPNFRVKAAGAELLTLPYARIWSPMLVGAERSFEPANEAHATLWTTKYPTTAILPMMALVSYAATLPYENITQPALFIYSNDDQVVDPEATKKVIARWGGQTSVHLVNNADDTNNHVIAGDALSPNKNDEVADVISNWLEQF